MHITVMSSNLIQRRVSTEAGDAVRGEGEALRTLAGEGPVIVGTAVGAAAAVCLTLIIV